MLSPVDGPFTLYKKTIIYCPKCAKCNGVITELLVPIGAMMYKEPSQTKIRVDRARVLSHNRTSDECSHVDVHPTITYSAHDATFRYKIGEIVTPKMKFSHQHEQCASGIHGFESRKEAFNYDLRYISPTHPQWLACENPRDPITALEDLLKQYEVS